MIQVGKIYYYFSAIFVLIIIDNWKTIQDFPRVLENKLGVKAAAGVDWMGCNKVLD